MKSYKNLMAKRGREVVAELDHSNVYAVREKGGDRIKYLIAKVFVLKSTNPPFTHTLCFHGFDRGHMMEGELLQAGPEDLTFRLQATPDGETLIIDTQALQMVPLTLAEFNVLYRSSADPPRRLLMTIDDVYNWYLGHVPEP